jgi:hypothetical protein
MIPITQSKSLASMD